MHTTGERKRLEVDTRFTAHFSKLQQVFLYINDDCNLSCDQCIYKPNVTYHEGREIAPGQVMSLLDEFRKLGAFKLTILGGEPTLYGARHGHRPLRNVIEYAKRIGFSYVRLDTNGHFAESLFETGGLDQLDELAFSLDGYDERTNDLLRGDGSFGKTIPRIRKAVELGIRTSITCCIHRELAEKNSAGRYGVERVVELGRELGVNRVNFHDLFKAGVPMDAWTGDHNTSVEAHIEMYSAVRPRIEAGEFEGVDVRLPQCFVTKVEFDRNPSYYGFCPVKLGERVMVHSDGVIRICSNLICSSFGSATFDETSIKWNTTNSNEVIRHDLTQFTPCTNRSKNMKYGDYVPLCFSFKPNQEEPVWQSLDWDSRRERPLVPPSSNGPAIQRRTRRRLIPVQSAPVI